MQKINKVKWNRHEIYTLFSWDRTSGTQHDKARPSADKLAAQKHDHNECTPRIKQYLLSTQHPLPSHSFLPSSALLPLHKVCTHTHTHANTHTHGNKYKPDRNDNEPLSPLSIDRSTRNQYAIRLNLGEWGAWCNICTWISWVTGAPQNNLQNSSVNNALFFLNFILFFIVHKLKEILSGKFSHLPQYVWVRAAQANLWTPSVCNEVFVPSRWITTSPGPAQSTARGGNEIRKEQARAGVISRLHLFLLSGGRRASYL